MKMLTLLTLLIAASVATAQTETAAPAMPTAPAATEVKAEAAAPTKKAKKVKKAAKPKAGMKVPMAPATTTMTAPEVIPATTAAMPAANTTIAQTTTAVAAPTKAWNVTLLSQGELSNDDLKKDIGTNGVKLTNYIGAGYRFNPDLKISALQYFDLNTSNADGTDKSAKMGFTVLRAQTKKIGGIFGSADISPMIWYYAPTNAALKNVFDADINHNGILRVDAEIAWELNPKWTVSYYLNPRQSFVPEQTFNKLSDGTAGTIESQSRLLQYGYVYYSAMDGVTLYSSIGLDSRMATLRQTSVSDVAMFSVGLGYITPNKMFNLVPEIGTSTDLKTKGVTASAPKFFQSESFTYGLTAVMNY